MAGWLLRKWNRSLVWLPSFLVLLNVLRWQWTALLSFLHLQISVCCMQARRERSHRRQCGGWSPLQTRKPRKNTKLSPDARFCCTRTSKGPDSLDHEAGADSVGREVENAVAMPTNTATKPPQEGTQPMLDHIIGSHFHSWKLLSRMFSRQNTFADTPSQPQTRNLQWRFYFWSFKNGQQYCCDKINLAASCLCSENTTLQRQTVPPVFATTIICSCLKKERKKGWRRRALLVLQIAVSFALYNN